MSSRSACVSALVLVLGAGAGAGCGDDGGPAGRRDAGGDAAAVLDGGADGGPGALAVALEGPGFAYVGEEGCFVARHSGGPDAVLTFLWGDESSDEVRGGDRACHAWTYPGDALISVVAQARGMRADTSVVVHVVFRPSTPAPAASSPIVYDTARDRVWVVSPDADRVSVLTADPPALLREIPVCDRPRTVAIAGDVVAVACQGAAALAIIDAVSLEPRGEVPLPPAGSEPFGVVADPRGGGRVFVSLLATGRIAAVEIGSTTPRVIGGADVGPDPRGLAINADGVLLVTRWRSSLDGARVRTVDVRDPAAPVLAGEATLAPSIGVDSDTDNDGVPGFLDQIVFSPDGARALIPSLKANVVAGTFRTGLPLSSQTTARAMLTEVMAEGAPGERAAEESFRFSFDDLDHASALVFSPEGERLYVAFQGAEVVVALDPFAFNTLGSISDVGMAPQGLAVSPDGRRLFVHAYNSREVRVYDVSDLSRAPEPLAVIRSIAGEPLDPVVLEGQRLFYRSRDPRMSRTSYLSCASCHLDGEGDGLIWDFTQRGEGLRNTIPLRAHGQGALHWSANFDEVQDFEHDIRGGQGGTGFLPDDVFHAGTRDQTLGDPKAGLSPELDALAAFVASLGGDVGASPFRRDGDAAWEASLARGRTVFEGAGCPTCHFGPDFTDSGFDAGRIPRLHDVGTLGPGSGSRLGAPLTALDTPTLRRLWRSAPYLHDGSAPTLREVLVDRNPEDRHGTTTPLTPTQLADLETYLLSLDD